VTDELTPAQRAAVAPLKARRVDCPSAETLVEYETLAAPARASHPAHDHIALCSRCQLVLLHIDEPGRRATWRTGRWLLPLAAVVLLGVSVTLVWRPPAPAIDESETVRGVDIQAIAPIGATEQLREFVWQSPMRADRYRVTVRSGTTVVWVAETTRPRAAAPPPGTIERDVQYEWQVEALDREGNVRMTSPSQSFVVY